MMGGTYVVGRRVKLRGRRGKGSKRGGQFKAPHTYDDTVSSSSSCRASCSGTPTRGVVRDAGHISAYDIAGRYRVGIVTPRNARAEGKTSRRVSSGCRESCSPSCVSEKGVAHLIASARRGCAP